MQLQLEFKEKSKNNKVFIVEKYYGGDADTEHFEEFELTNFTMNYDNNIIVIDDSWKSYYEQLKDALRNYEDYNDVLNAYNEEIADAWDNAPNDPQNDYQNKTRLDSVFVVYYDHEGTKFQAYLI